MNFLRKIEKIPRLALSLATGELLGVGKLGSSTPRHRVCGPDRTKRSSASAPAREKEGGSETAWDRWPGSV